MRFVLEQRLMQQCRVCKQYRDSEQAHTDAIEVALKGAVAYKQCPSCHQIVPNHLDTHYRVRADRFVLRRAQRAKEREEAMLTAHDKERLALVQRFLAQYEQLNRRGQPYDPAGWIMLKLSCRRGEAQRLIDAAKAAESAP